MRKALALLLCLVAGAALADLAVRNSRLVIKSDTGVALSSGLPTTGDGDGGYSLVATDLTTAAAGCYVTKVWCELSSTAGTAITGGTLRWLRQTPDGGWAAATSLDETITATSSPRWASRALSLAGVGTTAAGHIYCQTISATVTGGDAGLNRDYNFQVECP